jgi:hypothetical protein
LTLKIREKGIKSGNLIYRLRSRRETKRKRDVDEKTSRAREREAEGQLPE